MSYEPVSSSEGRAKGVTTGKLDASELVLISTTISPSSSSSSPPKRSLLSPAPRIYDSFVLRQRYQRKAAPAKRNAATPARTPPMIAPLRDEEVKVEDVEVGACTTVVLIPGIAKLSKLTSPADAAVKLEVTTTRRRSASESARPAVL